MGTDPWFHVRILGFCFITLCLAGLPTLALAQPEKLEWKNFPSYDSANPILFLWGTVTLATLGRIYASLYKKKNDLDPADLADMPAKGRNLGQKLHDWYETFAINKEYSLADIRSALEKPDRITHDTNYDLKPTFKEELTRMMGHLLLRFDELETLHEEPLDQLNDISTRLRDLMALPDEETLENMLQHTEELLKFAKGIKREFNQWFPEETNTTLENVIRKLEEHFQAAQNIEEQERSRWEAALRTCLPKAYHQNRPAPGQEPLIPALWASAVQACLDSADAAAQKVRDQVAALAQQITGWEAIGRTTQYNNNIVSPDVAAPIIAKWKARADYGPLFSWMKIAAAEQDKVLSGQQLKETMETAMVAWLDQTNQNIPTKYRDTSTEDFADRLNNSILQLRKGINRMSKYMSGVTSTTTTVTETDADQLRNLISPKYFPNSGPLNYDQLLAAFQELNKERLDAITMGKKPMPGPAPCRHPQELSLILVNDEQQSWTNSLDQVQHLLDDQHRQPPAPGNDDQERLFSSTDVPKLTDEDDYWTYRRSFEIFASAVTVRPAQIPQAMSRLLNRYEGKRRAYMMAYDVNANIKPTWTPTWKAILAYMDARFLDRDAHLQLFKKWLTLRYNEQRWGQDFIAEFDRIRMTLNQIAPVQGKVVISDDKSLERLMDKIPARLRDRLRYKYPNMEYQLMDETDPTKLEDIYDWIVDEWKYLHQIGQLSDGKKADDKKSHQPRSSAANPPAVQNPPAQRPANLPIGQNNERRVPLFGECNKPCFDTTPSVPSSMRASAMTIRQQLQDANLCFRCRRPQEDHNGPKIGCQLPGNHRLHTATRRAGAPQPDFDSDPASNAASTSGNDSGDN